MLQCVLSVLKVGRSITFVPYSVVLGFVNWLAILIFLAQVPFLVGVPWVAYALVALTIAIVHLLPRVTKAVPSSLVAIVVVTALAIGMRLDLQTVGDLGTIIRSLPAVPFTPETLLIILPYAAMLTVVGLLESLLTASIVDEMTSTRSGPRGAGPGDFELRRGPLRRHGRLCDDRPVGDQCQVRGSGRLSTMVAGHSLSDLPW